MATKFPSIDMASFSSVRICCPTAATLNMLPREDLLVSGRLVWMTLLWCSVLSSCYLVPRLFCYVWQWLPLLQRRKCPVLCIWMRTLSQFGSSLRFSLSPSAAPACCVCSRSSLRCEIFLLLQGTFAASGGWMLIYCLREFLTDFAASSPQTAGWGGLQLTRMCPNFWQL